MGGNVRHADKGPDRSVTTCQDCSEDFTHGKYSHFDYCSECRENRQKNADIKSNVKIVKDSGTVQVVIEITNNSEVDVKIPAQQTDDEYYDHTVLYGIIGYIRLKSENWCAENAVIVKSDYGNIRVRSESTKTYKFVIENDDVVQQDKPRTKSYLLGKEFREDIKITRGEIKDGDTLSVLFEPTEETRQYIKRSADSINSL